MQIENGIEETADLRHLYVHIPFCPKVCPYCSFYKEASDRNKTQAFLDSVLLDLDRRLREVASCRMQTIFFGGGTPSALSVKQLEFLFSELRRRLDLTGLREWTLEMNPATVSLEKAQMMRDYGVNRVSMGVQSWDPEILKRLGRVHSAPQAERSFHLLREAGFTNLNLDLIFGWSFGIAEVRRQIVFACPAQPHKPVRIEHGKPLQQKTVDRVEYRRSRADAERQRENGYRAPALVLKKHAQGIPDVSC